MALVWNTGAGEADLAIAAADLATDDGLETAVILSLFCDAPAQPGDAIPDGSGDRRGWWGDLPVSGADSGGTADHVGSRLWLLERALQVPDTLRRAEVYAREALQWMIDDGVAGSVVASASFPALGQMALSVTIGQEGSAAVFDYAWSMS
ncbi:MAG: phage GP46 family protein [Rhodospirillales bacterium]|nr:phage GP46 family protein [Rhodospirillales bacterium]